MRTYGDTIKFLDSFLNYERIGFDEKKDFKLDRLKYALKELGNPEKSFVTIHVAGTKGKGSVCTYTESILRACGYRTGLFTSPHLHNMRERISINGYMITKEDLTSVLDDLIERLGGNINSEFTYFEILTLIAARYFEMKRVSFAVFETGMGGRLDATNIIDADICSITPISYDHTEILGDTIKKIAGEKAAIIKNGSKCVSLEQRKEALEVIREKCSDSGAELFLVGEDIRFKITDQSMDGTRFNVSGLRNTYTGCYTKMPGIFQVSNAAAGIALSELAADPGRLSPEAVKKGISEAFIPGRMEVVSRNPFIILDGAQNAHSAEALKYSVEQIRGYDKVILLIGLSRDKDIRGFCERIVPMADEIVLTKAALPRASDPEIIRGYIRGKKVKMSRNSSEALGLALKDTGDKDLVLVTGSFYAVAEVRELVLGRVAGNERCI